MAPTQAKRIAPAAIVALKEAMTNIYWYKPDLRSFLTNCLSEAALVGRLNWDEKKRNIVAQLVDYLTRNQDRYQDDLIHLMTEVAKVTDYSHLKRLEDGDTKAKLAKESVRALQVQLDGHRHLVEEAKEIEKRRAANSDRLSQIDAVREKLDSQRADYFELLACNDSQKRGYKLEKLLYGLFELFDLDPKASFKISGEQIDGAFTFETTDYLLEAKWQAALCNAADFDVLAGKLGRKLDNTLGLFLSINGFSEDGVARYSAGRSMMVLMDGADLMAVLEGRVDLGDLLLRKRRAAAQTGNIYLKVNDILAR